MRAVLRLAASGLRRPSASLLLVGAVVALASAGLAASLAVRAGAAGAVDEAFEDGHQPDVVLTVARGSGAAAAMALRADDGVDEVSGPWPAIETQIVTGDDPSARVDYLVRVLGGDGSGLAEPVLTGGRRPERAGEILLDAAAVAAGGPGVGETVEIVGPVGRVRLSVVGTAYDLTDCFHPTCSPARAWVTAAGFAPFTNGEVVERIDVDAVDGPAGDGAAVAERLGSRIGSALLGSTTWEDTRGDLLATTEFYGAFLGTFGVFVALSAGVVVAGTVTARTAARRRTIAVQKAVGCTTAQLWSTIVIEHVLVTAIGCGIGLGLAWVAAPSLRVGPRSILEAGGPPLAPVDGLITVAVVTGLVVLATALPAWRYARVGTVDGLRDEPARPGRVTRVARRSGARRLPVTLGLGWRAAAARPVRTVLAALGIAIAIVAAIVATSINRSVDRVLAEPAFAGDPADLTVRVPATTPPTEAEAALAAVDGVAGWFSVVDDRGTIAGAEVHVRALGGRPADAGYVIGAGVPLTSPGQAIAGYGLLEEMGWSVGDRLALDIAGTRLDLELVGWYRETEDAGAVLQIRAEDHARARPGARPGYGIVAEEGTTTSLLAAVLDDALGDGTLVRSGEPDGREVEPFRRALRVMSALIAAVAAAQLVASAVTTSREQRRRTGTLRAVGVTTAGLMGEAATHAAAIAGLALVAGFALGAAAQRFLGDLLTTELGAGPGLTVGPTPGQQLAIGAGAVLATTGLAVVAAWPVLRRPAAELVGSDRI